MFFIDGYNRSHITINGQMPGPLVEANEGDTLVCQSSLCFDDNFISAHYFLLCWIVHVTNALSNNTASIVCAKSFQCFVMSLHIHFAFQHWHGMYQNGRHRHYLRLMMMNAL